MQIEAIRCDTLRDRMVRNFRGPRETNRDTCPDSRNHFVLREDIDLGRPDPVGGLFWYIDYEQTVTDN